MNLMLQYKKDFPLLVSIYLERFYGDIILFTHF